MEIYFFKGKPNPAASLCFEHKHAASLKKKKPKKTPQNTPKSWEDQEEECVLIN